MRKDRESTVRENKGKWMERRRIVDVLSEERGGVEHGRACRSIFGGITRMDLGSGPTRGVPKLFKGSFEPRTPPRGTIDESLVGRRSSARALREHLAFLRLSPRIPLYSRDRRTINRRRDPSYPKETRVDGPARIRLATALPRHEGTP